jgi:hypothetical protein
VSQVKTAEQLGRAIPPPRAKHGANNDTNSQKAPRGDDEDSEQQIFEELLTKYSTAICTSEQLESLDIPARKFLMGQWMREGDLGFVFGERGSGKTWLVDAIATHLSTGKALDDWAAPEARDVLLIDGEMPLDSARDRASISSDLFRRFRLVCAYERLAPL